MVSDHYRLDGKHGIERLDQIGAYIIIANKTLFQNGTVRRFVLVNEHEQLVDSVHGSRLAAVKNAKKRLKA
jgi:hypothetical protein